MKLVPVVFRQAGENAGTLRPERFFDNFSGDLNETCLRCRAFDDDGQVEVPMYNVQDVFIPDWMDEQAYLKYHIQLRFATALGIPSNVLEDRIGFINFISLDESYEFFIGWLFSKYKNTKNDFMRSMIEQVQCWLDAEPGSHKYNVPLSNKQFIIASKYCPLYEAKQIANQVYWSR